MPSASRFSAAFYRSIAVGSARTAGSVAPLIQSCIAARSVVDFGCGSGTWLEAFRACGIDSLLGLDQFDTESVELRIARAEYRKVDLTKPVDIGVRFDLALCLEVAEHLPPEASRVLVRNLVRAADRIVFSAAVPGQGGVGHFNEKPLAEWVRIFAEEGYAASDFVRVAIAKSGTEAEPWYRFNTLFFYRAAQREQQPRCVTDHDVADPELLYRQAPAWWRLRCAIIGLLPVQGATALANLKREVHAMFIRS